MTTKPFIILTNDDGISAPGIYALWFALKDLADILIVAPQYEQSATGLSISIRTPLRILPYTWNECAAWSVNGTPADCIKVALKILAKRTPDLILSGINRGSNAGRNLLYSGTVGGTIEGVMQGIPSIAFSCYDYNEPNYSQTYDYVRAIVMHVLKHQLPEGTLLNVNFPSKDKVIQGIKLTRQGKEYWVDDLSERRHPTEGEKYYWLGAKLAKFQEHDDCDISWLDKGYIAAVPVHVGELTDHAHLEKHRSIFDESLQINASANL